MIPRECKRLAEVDFPIAVVSKHAAKEKSIRHGHPSTLHLWWARRPLASSRAVLLGLLLPDPCDGHCPPDFKAKAKKLLPQVGCGKGETDSKLRDGLLKFIGDFANWDLSANATYLAVARGLVKAAHPEETPLVVDPFAGGGSIPLEALRLGCDAFASDLNPVACLILKVMLEDIPRNGPGFADELRKAGAEIKKQAEKELADLYPTDPDGARPIAYIWARTVRCESPDCGAEIPLARSFWLSKKVNRRRAIRPMTVRTRGSTPTVEFEIFEPATEDDVPRGTVKNAKAACVCCGRTLAADRLRAQLTQQRGGPDTIFDGHGHRRGGALLLAVVFMRPGEPGRDYRLAGPKDYEAVWRAQERLAEVAERESIGERSVVPDEPINPIRPSLNARGMSAVTRYGMTTFGDLFTARQKLSLLTLARIGRERPDAETRLAEVLALAISRLSDISNAGCRWESTKTQVRNLFTRQAIPMVWDFAETSLSGGQAGDFLTTLETMLDVVRRLSVIVGSGQVEHADACASHLPEATASVWFTDPPYYDAIPYADLSDFFLVWLKRALPQGSPFWRQLDGGTGLSPKLAECVWNQGYEVAGKRKDGKFFEETVERAFAEGRKILKDDGISAVVFAHKTTEGWEALLSGMMRAGLSIHASWPISTELRNRPNARENASLATSVHLICRPRTNSAIGDWREVLRELPRRVSDWMLRLQVEHVRGADLVFACIGPALEIFSRYAKVETAEGREVPLAEYLEKVWEVVGRAALEQVLGGSTGALEEDARLTALFLWTLQSSNGVSAEAGGSDEQDPDDDEDDAPKKKKTGGYSLVFDVVRRFAQPLGIHLSEWEGRIIETEKGVVRLLPVVERAKQLFGEDGVRTAAAAFERNPVAAPQMVLFPEDETIVPKVKSRGRKRADGESKVGSAISSPARREATTLDRVHAAMLLQRSGQANALRALLSAEQDRGPDFLRLANALSALYPRESEEKRLLDAMVLALPR